MKRKKIALVLALFFSFFLTACTQKASDPNQDNWAKYQKQGSITIGFDNTFVPMGFEEKNGQYAGFDIDLAQAVSEKLGIQIKFQPIDWDMKETELQMVPLMPSGMAIQLQMNGKRRLLLPFLTWKINKFWSLKSLKISTQFRI